MKFYAFGWFFTLVTFTPIQWVEHGPFMEREACERMRLILMGPNVIVGSCQHEYYEEV